MSSANSAGIYIHTGQRSIDAAAVIQAVAAFWHDRGAFGEDRSVFALDPMDVNRSGRLGVGVLAANPEWLLVLDSERYTADVKLAAHLHATFGVDVVAYALSDDLQRGWMLRYHTGESDSQQECDPAIIKAAIDAFPEAFRIMPERGEEQDEGFAESLVVDGVGLQPDTHSDYRGPELQSKAGRWLRHRYGDYLRKTCSSAFAAFLRGNPDIAESLLSDLRHLDLTAAACREFTIGLTAEIFAIEEPAYGDRARAVLAQAAFRSGDQLLFERAFGSLPVDHRVWELQSWVARFANERSFEAALAAFVQIEEHGEPNDQTWNNFCFTLAHLDPRTTLGDRLHRYLDAARQRAPSNPHIFHNLACVHLKLDDLGAALDCVEGAIQYEYPLLDRMRLDEDLVSLHGDPRWQAAWQAYDRAHEQAHAPESIRAPILKIVKPGVGVEIEGKGTLDPRMGLDELFAVTGEPPDNIDTAHCVYRFDELDLTISTAWGARVLIQHLSDASTTVLHGLDLRSVSADDAVAHVSRALGEEPQVAVQETSRDWIFVDNDLELGQYFDTDPKRLTVVVLSVPGHLREDMQDRVREASEAAALERERADRRHREHLERLREYFDRRDEPH